MVMIDCEWLVSPPSSCKAGPPILSLCELFVIFVPWCIAVLPTPAMNESHAAVVSWFLVVGGVALAEMDQGLGPVQQEARSLPDQQRVSLDGLGQPSPLVLLACSKGFAGQFALIS